MHSGRPQRTVLWVALAVCLLKGLLAAVVTPAFQTPDEYGHHDYVLYLSHIRWGAFLAGDIARPTGYNDITTDELWAVTRATGTESHLRDGVLHRPLPLLSEQIAAGRGFVPSDTHEQLRTKVVVAPQFNYPLLYYGMAAALVRVVRVFTPNPVVAYYVVRLASLALILLTVAFVWRTAVLAFGPNQWLPVALASFFTALQPQLGMLGTSVQSDVLTIALVTLAGSVASAYAIAPARGRAAALGGLIGLLLLTKIHAAAAVAAAVTALIVWTRRRHGLLGVLWHLVPAAALAAALGLWWYARSYILYDNPTGMVGDFKTAQFSGKRENVKAWIAQWRLTVESFWGKWGWLEVPLPGWHYTALGWLSGVSVLPVTAALMKRPPPISHTPMLAYWVVLSVAYAGIMVVVAALVGPVHNNQGRHWLPLVAVPALVLAVAGAVLQERSPALARLFLATWCVILLAANLRLALATSAFYGGYGL